MIFAAIVWRWAWLLLTVIAFRSAAQEAGIRMLTGRCLLAGVDVGISEGHVLRRDNGEDRDGYL
jgi:hypothetical protein